MMQNIDEEALRWFYAQRRDDMDWDAFAIWLEADPRHRDAYDDMALLDEAVERHRETLSGLIMPQPEAESRKPRSTAVWVAASASVVACLAALFALLPKHPPTAPTMVYATVAGQSRVVALGDGAVATLAPGSSLSTNHRRGDPLNLDGSVYFDVRHDPTHPVIVRAAGFEISDIGTRFEIKTGPDTIRVAVAEGQVSVHSTSMIQDVRLRAGQALTAVRGSRSFDIAPAITNNIGQRDPKQLRYDNVALDLVAADVSRYSGLSVVIDPDLAPKRFSGVLSYGSRDKMVTALKEMMDLDARMDGQTVRLVPARR